MKHDRKEELGGYLNGKGHCLSKIIAERLDLSLLIKSVVLRLKQLRLDIFFFSLVRVYKMILTKYQLYVTFFCYSFGP